MNRDISVVFVILMDRIKIYLFYISEFFVKYHFRCGDVKDSMDKVFF